MLKSILRVRLISWPDAPATDKALFNVLPCNQVRTRNKIFLYDFIWFFISNYTTFPLNQSHQALGWAYVLSWPKFPNLQIHPILSSSTHNTLLQMCSMKLCLITTSLCSMLHKLTCKPSEYLLAVKCSCDMILMFRIFAV